MNSRPARFRFRNLLASALSAVGALFFLFTCGCSSIIDARKQKAEIMQLYQAGQFYEAAIKTMEKAASREGTGDELMWRLEEGSLFFDSGDPRKSLEAFDRAELLVQQFDDRASISARDAAAEGGSAITNPNALPYRGFNYDRILLNVYKALDYFALGDPGAAMVEIRRLHERQNDAKKRFEAEIEAEQERIRNLREKNRNELAKTNSANRSSDVQFEQLLGNPEIAATYEKSGALSNAALRDFLNPFATYVSAIGYLVNGNQGEAAVDLRNLYEMDKSNPLFARDLVTICREIGQTPPESIAELEPHSHSLTRDVIFVLFANGLGPALLQKKVDLILPFVGYTGFAYPDLETFPPPHTSVSLSDSHGNSWETLPIADLDKVFGAEYHQLLPMIIVRIAISTIAKEVASYAAVYAAEKAGGTGAMLGAYVATGVYKYLFNTADTRCWQTLPAQVQAIHFPKPEDGKLTVAVGQHRREVTVAPDKKFAILYVKSPEPGVCSIHVFEF